MINFSLCICWRNAQITLVEKPQLKIIKSYKVRYGNPIDSWSDKTFKGPRHGPFKGSVWLEIVFELRLQEIFKDSFKTYKTFLRCIFVQQECKFNLLNSNKLLILKGWFWESVFKKLFNDKKRNKNSILN